LIKKAKSEALKNVNKELINLYWNVGKFISNKLKSSQCGDAVVEELARYLQRTQPGLQGFSRRGLYRMRQFYETYNELENVSTRLTQIPWSGDLHIMAKCKTIEEKEFYLRIRKMGQATLTLFCSSNFFSLAFNFLFSILSLEISMRC